MASKKSKILIVDDDHSLSSILMNVLDYEGYNCAIANNGRTALSKMESEIYDLLLLDLKLPDISGLEILEKNMTKNPPSQVVMISGQGTIETAVEATRLGAYDFLEKPLDTERVLVTIKNAMMRGRLEREKAHLLESVKEHYTMVGESLAMVQIREFVSKAAATDSKILIEGENGTGKELVARAIYFNSKRVGRPFVAVNCAAIPESLIESELFGHKKGSFTGAVTDKKGRFQMADEGTLFFDEIGDMSLMTQAKVLRVLEEGIVEMVGGSEPIRTDVRIIAATNKDLQKEMEQGQFREDLYFRLNVLNVKVAPLRERKEDIPLLVNHFVGQYCEEHQIERKQITPNAMSQLIRHKWPGNIREVKNTVEKLIVFVEGEKVRPEDVISVLNLKNNRRSKSIMKELCSLKDAKMKFEREFIYERLVANDWNITEAARMMKISRTYLHSKIKKLGIHI